MSHDSSHSSLKAVLYALGANGGIAVGKGVLAFFTGSGAMLAESLHSLADCANQVLLLIGMKSAKKPPTERHPMGYGRAVYFWSLMVGFLLFSVGGVFSIKHGYDALNNSHPIAYIIPSIVMLVVAVILEGISLRNALQATKAERGDDSLWQWFKDTRQSELLVVVGEDVAALLGLFIALVALVLTAVTGNPIFDAIGSMVVGALLVVVAVLIVREVSSLSLGESVSPKLRKEITKFVEAQPEVDKVINMITQQWGDYMMVALKVQMKPMGSDVNLVKAINEVEERMQKHFVAPRLRFSFFEPDLVSFSKQ